MEAKISRSQAVDLVRALDVSGKSDKWIKPHRHNSLPHHFGLCELRDLLDAIYGEPKSEDEKLYFDRT